MRIIITHSLFIDSYVQLGVTSRHKLSLYLMAIYVGLCNLSAVSATLLFQTVIYLLALNILPYTVLQQVYCNFTGADKSPPVIVSIISFAFDLISAQVVLHSGILVLTHFIVFSVFYIFHVLASLQRYLAHCIISKYVS